MGFRCKRLGCMCSHIHCDIGWVTVEYEAVHKKRQPSGEIVEVKTLKEGARPCPECLPDRAALFFKAQNREELQELLQERSNKPKESNEPKTRIL